MRTPAKRKVRLYAKLNSFVWRERWQSLALPVFFCILILVGLLVSSLLQKVDWREGKRLTGTIVGINQTVFDGQTLFAPRVDLDSGPAVGLTYTSGQNFEKGQRVVVQEYVSDIFRKNRYEFIARAGSN